MSVCRAQQVERPYLHSQTREFFSIHMEFTHLRWILVNMCKFYKGENSGDDGEKYEDDHDISKGE